MTHKQQEEWAAIKKACVGLMAQVELLTRDLTEYAERYAALEVRVKILESATVPEALPV
jgi:phage shock protein A